MAPQAIDTEKLTSAKGLDLNKPPVKAIPYQRYPCMLYRHPADKSKEHITRIAHNEADEKQLLAAGWRNKPHVPVVADELPPGFEPERAEAAKDAPAKK